MWEWGRARFLDKRKQGGKGDRWQNLQPFHPEGPSHQKLEAESQSSLEGGSGLVQHHQAPSQTCATSPHCCLAQAEPKGVPVDPGILLWPDKGAAGEGGGSKPGGHLEPDQVHQGEGWR